MDGQGPCSREGSSLVTSCLHHAVWGLRVLTGLVLHVGLSKVFQLRTHCRVRGHEVELKLQKPATLASNPKSLDVLEP